MNCTKVEACYHSVIIPLVTKGCVVVVVLFWGGGGGGRARGGLYWNHHVHLSFCLSVQLCQEDIV